MSAGMIVSAASTKRIVYHRANCIYAKRMKPKNKMTVPMRMLLSSGKYCACKYCSSLRGDVRLHRNDFDDWTRRLGLQFLYDKKVDRLFIRTGIGFWKIIPSADGWDYYLYHLNHFSSDASMEVMAKWNFHRQNDVPASDSLPRLIHYIDQHDRAKEIIKEDYRKLPHATKTQKKYYRQAERREHKERCRRLDSLFDQVERDMKLDKSAGIQLRRMYGSNSAAGAPFSGLAS